MLKYATVGSNRLPEAKTFYDGLLADAGWQKAMDHPSGGRIYSQSTGSMFGVLGPYDGQPATIGNGVMLGFAMDSAEAVHAFHARAIALGGTCEGAPGNRGSEEAPYHFAYVRDLDGNKLCAYHIPAPKTE
jgi:catechol 2,3-dioxygenase-like lactoylglutathione lyase family enzyme